MFVPRRKLSLPPLPQPHLPRPRLVERLGAVRIACVVAPAGYGKTTLLLEHLHSAVGTRAWYTLDAADRDPTVLVAGLAAALGAPPPAAGAPSLQLAALCQWLEVQPAGATLVLDDLHCLAGAGDALRLLADLLQTAPPDLRLCLGGRTLPDIAALPRLRLTGQVHELGPADLAFSDAESRRLLDRIGHGGEPQQLHALSRGWPVALRLLAAVDAPERAGRAHLFDYLAAEVLAGLPPDRQRFLVEASVLEQWTPAACDFVLEREDSAALLAWLQGSQLLVSRDADGALVCHPLWLEFLQTRQRPDPGRYRHLQRRAALWCAQREEAEAALGHALAAADPGLIVPLLRRVADGLRREGHAARLQQWLEAVPEAVLETVPDLLLDVGEAMRRSGRPRWAVRWLQLAVLGYAAVDPGGGMLGAICRLAMAYGDLGEWAEARATLRQVESELADAGEREQGEALLALAEEAGAQGEWQAAVLRYREAANRFVACGERERAGVALAGLGARALAGAGQLADALDALHGAGELLSGAAAVDALLMEAAILLEMERGREAAAVLGLAEPRTPPQQALHAWLQARAAILDGDLFTADRLCRQGDRCLTDVERTPVLESAALLARGWLDQRSGNAGAALAAAGRALQLSSTAGSPLFAAAARWLLAACEPAAGSRNGRLQADLLGTFRVRCGEQELPPDAWGRAQVRALLQFLLLQPGCAAGREAMLDAFWPEAAAEQARALLRVSLHRLRKVLQGVGCELESTGELVRLPSGAVGWIDLVAFRSHLAAARAAVDGDPAGCLGHCRAARTLYRGDLLADVFWPWAEAPREQARRELAEILQLWQTAARRLARPEEAIAALEELLALDPASEAVARELIQLLAETGRRAEAVARYRKLVRWLRSELGVEPEAATRNVLQRLLD